MALRGIRTEHGLEGGELEALLGDRSALDHLFSVTYEELRHLASSVRRSDPNASLSPTTLVNEAWLKLRNSPRLAGVSRLHFKRIAARAMRQVLVEAARRRKAQKRGGGLAIATFDDAVAEPPSGADQLLGLEAEQLIRAAGRLRDGVVEGGDGQSTATFLRLPSPGGLDQDLPHGARRDPFEVQPGDPGEPWRVPELEPGFVDQGGGTE